METRIPTVIVDDHDHARSFIRRFVEKHFGNDIVLLGEAYSVESALALIQRVEPRLLFLDIDLGDGNGFELLDLLESRREKIQVIIVTAFKDQYKAALRYEAVEYLDKPVLPKEFQEGVTRVIKKVRTMMQNEAIVEDYQRVRAERDKLAAQLRHQTDVRQTPEVYVVRHQSPVNPVTRVPIDDIIYFLAQKHYSTIYRASTGKTIEVSKNLGSIAKELAAYPFFVRIGRSHIINLRHCSVEINPHDDDIHISVRSLGNIVVEKSYKHAVHQAITPFLRPLEK